MSKHLTAALAACVLAVPALADEARPAKVAAMSPNEIVAAAAPGEWTAIAPADLLVMDLAPGAKANPRRIVIQLMPAPFSQGWVDNIRKLAAAHWWDGTAVVRVQDNYVTQWGDPTEKKALPAGLEAVPEAGYVTPDWPGKNWIFGQADGRSDAYAGATGFHRGWPLAQGGEGLWPTHCYGMVGVARDMSPNTGSGAELYTVIGHAPRHLDRNIALVGRVISGMEHLSSLPRGTGALGFYENDADRVPIQSVRLASEMATGLVPAFEYLATESASFAKYADARANRRDPFFIVPAGGADICNIPVPVRAVSK